jgi:hypothetical protein
MRRVLSAAMALVFLLMLSGCDASGLAEKGEAWTQKAESAWNSFEAELTVYGYQPSDEVREALRDAAEYTGDSAKRISGRGELSQGDGGLIGETGCDGGAARGDRGCGEGTSRRREGSPKRWIPSCSAV